MWVTKLLIFPVEISIFCPKTTKFGPKLAFLVNLGQAMQAYSLPCCVSVGGFRARAVSRKTPIYFIHLLIEKSFINVVQTTKVAHRVVVSSTGSCNQFNGDPVNEVDINSCNGRPQCNKSWFVKDCTIS